MKLRKLHILFSLTIVMLIILVFLYYRIDPRMASSVNSSMNDEAFYYAQIKTIQKCGRPLGYFGYNGSKALIGGFGAWSPILIYLYALLSFPFSFSTYSVMITNLVLVSVSMFVFLELQNADWKNCFAYVMPMTIFYVVRYAYSGMAEGLFYAMIILICGLFLSQRRAHGKWLGLFVVFLMALMRPYYVVLFPLFLYRSEAKLKSLSACICAIIVTLFLYFFINHYFCAAYLGAIIRLPEVLALFNCNIAQWFSNITAYVYSNIRDFFNLVVSSEDAIRMKIGSLLYLLVLVVGIFVSILDKEKKSKGFLYVLILAVLMPIVFVNIYTPVEIDRHLSAFILLLSFFLIHEVIRNEKRGIVYCALAFCFIVTDYLYFSFFPNRWATRDCSDYNMTEISLRTGDNGYENTIAMVWWDESYHAIYSLPAGFGVNYCDSEYLEMPEEVTSRYVLLLKTKYLNEMYRQYKVVYENDALLIYDLMA